MYLYYLFMLLFWQRRGTCTSFWKHGCHMLKQMSGKEQILKSKYEGFFSPLLSLIFSITFSPPVWMSPSLVVFPPSVICSSIKGSNFKMKHFFCICGLVKNKKDIFTLEKGNESRRICTEMREQREQERGCYTYTCSTQKIQICFWSKNGVALVHNHYSVYYNYTYFRQREP